MSGIYGNSFIDRCLEQQLNSYLNSNDDWLHYCEAVTNHIPEQEWNDGIGLWYDGEVASKWLNKLCTDKGYEPEVTAKIMLRAYKLFKQKEIFE